MKYIWRGDPDFQDHVSIDMEEPHVCHLAGPEP